MPYLIDGHNLIGQTPGMSLDDPDDEAKLIQLVKRFCSRGAKRMKAIVIFDRGLPAGASRLSGGGVEVRFASQASSADALIRRRLRELRDANNWTVVTSDGKVAETARARGARVMSSAEFAAEMTAETAGAEKRQPRLSKEDVAQWEEEFRKTGRPAG